MAGGTISPNEPTAQVGENVNLQIEPANGYELNALKVTQTIDGKDYEVPVTGGLWHDTNPTAASFVMPANDVTITPIFTNNLTAEDGGLYINMPEFNYSYEPKTVNLANDITSFKVYDDGGKDGNCSPYCDSYMVLRAPFGKVLKLTGTVTVDESSSFLAVYDGDDTSHQIGTNYGNTTGHDIGQLQSSGRSLMLRFHTGYPSNYAGLNLTVEVVPPVDITLTDDADNTSDIDDNKGTYANVTLQGRTLYKDGAWNTLCLPFSLASLTDTPLEGATVMELDTEGTYDGKQTGLDGTTLYLYFKNATSITAGKPYIVRWGTPENNPGGTITNPVFNGVTVDNTNRDVIFTGGSFKGTYDKMAFAEENKSILFVGDDNNLHWPLSGATLGAFRAYFELADGVPAHEFVLNFGYGSEEMSISPAEIKEIRESASAWYTINGVRLSGKPAKKGLYIKNGKKIVVK